MIPYKAPELNEKAFNCPHCGAYTEQYWYQAYASSYGDVDDCQVARCCLCDQWSVWHNERMIYPDQGNAPLPNADLPEDIKVDYEEARAIVARSPRGAAALLRLAIQKLCKHLGEKGANINDDIAGLVSKGLLPKVQEALDAVRVIGNEAVHPGKMDLRDDVQTAQNLFGLVNLIAERMITHPKQVDALYENLPETKKEAISKRDEG